MKVLMVIPTFYPVVGGAERQLEGIAPVLVASGHHVTVLTRRLPGTSAIDRTFSYLVRRIPATPRPVYHLALAAYLLLNARQYDVIHCHTLSGAAAICSIVGALLDRPVLLKATRSGPNSQIAQWNSSVLRRLVFSGILMRYARFVAISRDTHAELLASGVPEQSIFRIPNGVAIPLSAATRSVRQPNVLYIGRLIPRKRVDLLLRAFAETSGGNMASLAIVGDGTERPVLEALARNLGIANRVTFTGTLDANGVRNWLRNSRIFVLPSSSEGMSNSLLEAMASGLAVLATDIEANRELIEPEKTGLLFSSEAELSSKLDELFSNAASAMQLGENAKARINAVYSFEFIAREYTTLYQTLQRCIALIE